MTCKDDCIHYDVCKKHYNETNSDLPDLFDLWLRPEICSDFKNKADFIEVVRCKDCKRVKPLIFENFYFCRKYRACRETDDYCSFGERRINND